MDVLQTRSRMQVQKHSGSRNASLSMRGSRKQRVLVSPFWGSIRRPSGGARREMGCLAKVGERCLRQRAESRGGVRMDQPRQVCARQGLPVRTRSRKERESVEGRRRFGRAKQFAQDTEHVGVSFPSGGTCPNGSFGTYWHLWYCRFFKKGSSSVGDLWQYIHKNASGGQKNAQAHLKGRHTHLRLKSTMSPPCMGELVNGQRSGQLCRDRPCSGSYIQRIGGAHGHWNKTQPSRAWLSG